MHQEAGQDHHCGQYEGLCERVHISTYQSLPDWHSDGVVIQVGEVLITNPYHMAHAR